MPPLRRTRQFHIAFEHGFIDVADADFDPQSSNADSRVAPALP